MFMPMWRPGANTEYLSQFLRDYNRCIFKSRPGSWADDSVKCLLCEHEDPSVGQ